MSVFLSKFSIGRSGLKFRFHRKSISFRVAVQGFALQGVVGRRRFAMDKGEGRVIKGDFKFRLGHLRALVSKTSKHSLDEFTLLRFKSASLGGKEFTSKAYSRHQSRCSYHVCFRTTDALSDDKYGDVVHYYLLHHRVSNERIRFCELQMVQGF